MLKTAEKQVAEKKFVDAVKHLHPQWAAVRNRPCEADAPSEGNTIISQNPRPLPIQDETAEQFNKRELGIVWTQPISDMEIYQFAEAYASSRLSAACPECNHPMRWHDNADGHWCMACVGRASETRFKLAEEEITQLRKDCINSNAAKDILETKLEEKLAAAEKELERLREALELAEWHILGQSDSATLKAELRNKSVKATIRAALGEAQKRTNHRD